MRLLLTLNSAKQKQLIPINYQYPLASAIYKILQSADAKYSAFLHEKGYGKGFKLFTFSDIKCPFKIDGDRLILLSNKIELIVCFHLPKAAETFIKGLFMSQQIDIADNKSKTSFMVGQVESLASPLDQFKENDEVEILLKPLSPIVCGLKNEKGNYDFLSPADDRYEEMLFVNWEEKCKAVFEKEEAERIMANAFIQVIFFINPPKSRLITIKANTDAETKIRGFNNFEFNIKGKKEAVELLVNSGVGLYNAQGMGCVEITEP
ncbi:MAG TPA: CRISPR-associated endoribonuclease Cas6 [Hanamia sp.]|nr:CRISPR-associated endoribonuclease Cas6 [Hanamia sp.]